MCVCVRLINVLEFRACAYNANAAYFSILLRRARATNNKGRPTVCFHAN